ncbi:MAG: DUF1028 domain-containing protein [Acidobacteria bacterium]|nr:DUF1028 domain-containing protein [Acidobacteriota bacterium]MCZ6753353.1 DUF1028 domain-containing protein [Acidobacteriota bacterium]
MILKTHFPATLLLLLVGGVPLAAQDYDPDLLGTYSIIARDATTRELGIGVQSKAFAVGNRVVDAKGGVGIIVHQAVSNPMYGVLGLELLQAGMTPQKTLSFLVQADNGGLRRQVAILDIEGRSAAWSGQDCTDWKGHHCTTEYCAQGNTLDGPQVLEAIIESMESSTGPLAERLLAALEAAQAAGGDWRGMQSAAILIVKPLAGAAGFSDRAVDIRVDDDRQPLTELRRLLDLVRSGEMIRQVNSKLIAGDLEGALELALAARDRSRENDNAWVALANVYVKMDRNQEAGEAFGRAIELNPANRVRLRRDSRYEALRQRLNMAE